MGLYTAYANKLFNGKQSPFLVFLMNLILMPVIILFTAAGLALFPFGFLFMKHLRGMSTSRITRKTIWIYGRVWQFFCRAFVRFEPIDFKPDQFSTPGIIVVNHRSFFDTYCMNMLPKSNICFAVRNWPFKIPVYNIFMNLAAYLNIEKFSWDKCVGRSKQTLKDNGFVLFFPEGHRSKGKGMTHFYSGAFRLAVDTGTPVIPVCLTGTQDLLPPGRLYMKPAHIKMKVLDPVFPGEVSGKLKHHALKKKVKDTMEKHLASMEGLQHETKQKNLTGQQPGE